jgi:hypothetical protein
MVIRFNKENYWIKSVGHKYPEFSTSEEYEILESNLNQFQKGKLDYH